MRSDPPDPGPPAPEGASASPFSPELDELFRSILVLQGAVRREEFEIRGRLPATTLFEQGVVTPAQAHEVLEAIAHTTLWCPQCLTTYFELSLIDGSRYLCRMCRSALVYPQEVTLEARSLLPPSPSPKSTPRPVRPAPAPSPRKTPPRPQPLAATRKKKPDGSSSWEWNASAPRPVRMDLFSVRKLLLFAVPFACLILFILAVVLSDEGGKRKDGRRRTRPSPERKERPLPPVPSREEPRPVPPSTPRHPWFGFGAGTYIRLRTITTMTFPAGASESQVETTHRLFSADASSAHIQVETVTPEGSSMSEYDVYSEEEDDSEKPARSGREWVEVPAGRFECDWSEYESLEGGQRTFSRVWESDKVPGGLVKSVSRVEGPSLITNITELQEVQIR